MPDYQTTCVRSIFLSSCLSLFAPPKYPVRYVGILIVELKIIKNKNYVQSERDYNCCLVTYVSWLESLSSLTCFPPPLYC